MVDRPDGRGREWSLPFNVAAPWPKVNDAPRRLRPADRLPRPRGGAPRAGRVAARAGRPRGGDRAPAGPGAFDPRRDDPGAVDVQLPRHRRSRRGGRASARRRGGESEGAAVSITTLLRYLTGSREAIVAIAGNRNALWVGFLFVLSAGFAREYDGED